MGFRVWAVRFRVERFRVHGLQGFQIFGVDGFTAFQIIGIGSAAVLK